MPRPKNADQIGVLEKQKSGLLAKLKENQKKTRQKQREMLDQKALIVGRAMLAELEERNTGGNAVAIRAILDARLTRPKDRSAFNLGPLPAEKTANQNSPSTPLAAHPKLDPAHVIDRVKPATAPPVAAPSVPSSPEPLPSMPPYNYSWTTTPSPSASRQSPPPTSVKPTLTPAVRPPENSNPGLFGSFASKVIPGKREK